MKSSRPHAASMPFPGIHLPTSQAKTSQLAPNLCLAPSFS
jgi:hypothetical protein